MHPNLSLPPIPAWNAAHPVLVHLPIGILAIVPVLLLITLCAKRMRQPFAFMTLVALALGTASIFAAIASGDEASHAAVVGGEAAQVLDEHEDLAELTRNIFIGLSAIYAVILLGAVTLGDKLGRKMWIGLHVFFLLLTSFGLLQLVHTGHLGGRLVHQYGVRAPIAPGGVGGEPMQEDGSEDETEPRR